MSIRRRAARAPAGRPRADASTPGPRRRDSRGAVLVEAALVTPVIILFMLVIVDTGLLLFTSLTTGEVAGEVAREAIVVRDDEDADARILDALEQRLTGLNRAQLERVVIYRANGVDDDPPTACTTGAVASSTVDNCSAYGPDDLDKRWDELDCGWCPWDRNEGDLVGVWVRLKFNSTTGLLPESSITDRQVRTIELKL